MRILDSTRLTTFRTCPYKYKLQYVDEWQPREKSIHLIAGAAFAAGVEATRRAYFVEGIRDRDLCLCKGIIALLNEYGTAEPGDSPKTAWRMLGALEYYFNAYPLEADGCIPLTINGQIGIEYQIELPLSVQGKYHLFKGRCDAVVSFAGGNYIIDEKTTSRLGYSWGTQWDMRSQFTAYAYLMQYLLDVKIDGIIVRGVSILKNGYDTAQVITTRSQYELQQWYRRLCEDIEMMERYEQTGYYPPNLEGGCTEYNGCPFQRVCKSPDDKKEAWLSLYYEKATPLLAQN